MQKLKEVSFDLDVKWDVDYRTQQPFPVQICVHGSERVKIKLQLNIKAEDGQGSMGITS